MKVGFTGTRKGMTNRQKKTLYLIMIDIEPIEFTHGGCYGADSEAHEIIHEIITPEEERIHIYPGNQNQYTIWKKYKRTDFLDYITLHEIMPYLKRNKKIVDSSNILAAAPSSLKEETRSGTWTTIRYARKQGKPIIILDP